MSLFSEMINPFIKTRNQIKNKEGKWVDQKEPKEEQFVFQTSGQEIGPNGYIIFNTDKKVIIDGFQFGATTRSYIRPRLHAKREFDYSGAYDNNLFVGVGSHATYFDASIAYIHDFGHPLLESTVNDTSNTNYKIINKVPIVLPQGGKLGFYSSASYDPAQHRWSCAVVWREIEVV